MVFALCLSNERTGKVDKTSSFAACHFAIFVKKKTVSVISCCVVVGSAGISIAVVQVIQVKCMYSACYDKG